MEKKEKSVFDVKMSKKQIQACKKAYEKTYGVGYKLRVKNLNKGVTEY
jgi:hypothetical protein